MPSDFFRTMEDASGVDLDWFWRGWFYTTDNVDIALTDVKTFKLSTKNPEEVAAAKRAEDSEKPRNITSIRNEKTIKQTQDEMDAKIKDYYSSDSPYEVSVLDKEEYQKYLATLSKDERQILDTQAGMNFYELTFEMKGELLSPIIVELQFADGTKDYRNIPAEIWRLGDRKVTKVFKTSKEVKQFVLDPYLETADVDVSNNYFPPRPQLSRFELYKGGGSGRFGTPGGENPMQRAKRAKASEKPNGGGQ